MKKLFKPRRNYNYVTGMPENTGNELVYKNKRKKEDNYKFGIICQVNNPARNNRQLNK